MRRAIVAGNWKMHGTRLLVAEFVHAFASRQADGSEATAVETVILPPVGYLAELSQGLSGTRVACGAQDLHAQQSGAYTGETAGSMIRDLGGQWVLTGHSERRQYQREDDDLVAAKFVAALEVDLCPILCVGESLDDRRAGRAAAVVGEQLNTALDTIGVERLAAGCVAYEPVWAIGTGETATPAQAQEMHRTIRDIVARRDAAIAAEVPVLYGGSVNENNAEVLFQAPDIDGVLVGGAALKAAQFAMIIDAAARAVAEK